MKFLPFRTPLYRVGINLLTLSQADEEIPTTDVKLEMGAGTPGGSDQIPNLVLECALRSPVQPHMAQPALAYTKVIFLHHPTGVRKRRIAAETDRDQMEKREEA